MNNFKKGSEWRRWDLHVHTPETALNNQFGDWEEYLTAIEAHPDIKVLGVTDYMTITNYSKLKSYRDSGRTQNIQLLIPNLEFRVAPPSEKTTAINIHLLISPDDPNHEREIRYALARLEWTYGTKRYSCIPEQLIDLGRTFDSSITDDGAALTAGVSHFKVDFSTFREWYLKEPWLKRNSFVGVAAGDDGLSGFSRNGAWVAWRNEITRFSQVLFCGRPGERDFWLGKRSPSDWETIRSLGGPKPCIHGSDAHSIGRLFQPDENRFCWIKADPTFEGLRQILYEPEDRVYIGPTPPIYHDKSRVLRSVKFSNANGWFDDIELPLNSGLISIIGQKGSGKSALAELIAYTTGSWEPNESSSFLKRAGQHLNGTHIEIEWADGATDSITLGYEQAEQRKVRYLSQKFVERLCAEDVLGSDLVHEIESVIFSHLDDSETMNASSFDELRAIRTAGIREEGERLRSEIDRVTREEFTLLDNASKLDAKKARIKTLTEEHKGLQKQIPEAASPEEAKIRTELQSKREALNKAQNNSATDKQMLQKISDIRKRIVAFSTQMSRFYVELESQLRETGVSELEFSVFRPEFAGDTEAPLARRDTILRTQIQNRLGDTENPAEGTIRQLESVIKDLEAHLSADQARQKIIKNAQTRIVAINSEIERINIEIAKIEGPEKARMAMVKNERRDAYIKYFANLRQEQTTLEELYTPVSESLHNNSAPTHEQELEFSIRWIANVESWIERGVALFDQRKNVPYSNINGMTKAAERILVPAWTSGDSEKVGPALDEFLEEFNKDAYLPASKYLRSGVTHMGLLQWLYEVDHISLSYGLKYNGTELEKLSPGTKGIVLLILYLGIDISDTRPLIVDQPDENLDNESIFQLLATYFRQAKQRRQIILITHNPNLVVNTDSEQIIVACAERRDHGLPHIQYTSGALENIGSDSDGIRQQVCRILEGGSDAFLRRERRYALTQQ
ncbi:MAG: hypothetical protein KC643_15975 [Nitrospira sp.]|nr:hypothetical protein [Nitrospira sp.]